ncbi:clan AA aspartic protease [Alkalinema pantanalense CENA528]|uniref:clan AA aspartic protease n=1 Tax=Alkalinema pantanalense TaxID=1620705 RepID=UPI003D6DD3CB
MMFGVVSDSCEAIIKVTIGGAETPKVTVDALIDTGFTSFLALPRSVIESLGLPWHFSDVGTLGDGSEVIFEVYTGHVIWDGAVQIIDVVASEAMPLVGMGLLYGFKLQIEAVEGGIVAIEAIR